MADAEPAVTQLIAVLSHPEEAGRAFPWAASLAREWGLPLTLLHVVDPVTSRELPENARAMAEDMLALLAASPPVDGLAVSTLVEHGTAEAILPAVAARTPGAIFLFSGGQHGAFARRLLRRGSNYVLQNFRAPFVFLPPATGAPQPIACALAGVDGSPSAEAALELGRRLLGANPLLELHVLEPGSLPANEYLAFEPSLTGTTLRMRGRAGVALLAAARARDARLIVVGRHGATGLFGQYLGGTAEWLSHNADRPLLIVPGE